MSWYLDQI